MQRQDIEITMDKNDFIMFRTSCNCSSNDHSLDVIVERDDGCAPMFTLYFKTVLHDMWDITYPYCLEENEKILRRLKRYAFEIPRYYFIRIWRRVKVASKILVTGWFETQDEFMFRDPEHAANFRKTLEDAINQVEKSKV